MHNSKSVKIFWMVWEKIGILIIFLLVVGIFWLLEPRVVEPAQIISVLNRSSWVAVAAIGMTFAICSGGFDLSAGAIASLCGSVLARTMMLNGFSTGAAIAATLGVAVVCGLINGLLITKLKIQPFVATLSTMLVFTGVNQVYTENQGTFIASERYGEVLRYLGRGELFGDFFARFDIDFNIPSKVLIVIVILIIAILVYYKTRFGAKVRAIGSNDLAARTSGIRADGVLIIVYIITAVTAALAAILWVSTVQTASPRIGGGWELDFITAVVLGGTALSGGKGNLIGTFIGAVMVAYIGMCLNFLSVPEAMIVIVTGGVLLFALSINGIKSIMLREVN